MGCALRDNLARIVRGKRGSESMRAFAARIGLSATHVSRVENKQLTSLETVERLVGALAIDPRDLFATDANHGEGI